MQITITGKQLDVSDAFREHARLGLEAAAEKYFANAMEGSVVIGREGAEVRADLSVHVGRGIQIQGHARAGDAHGAFDAALERITKRLRRHKRRLRDHHRREARDFETTPAQQYIFADLPEVGEGDDDVILPDSAADAANHPLVVAEMATEVVSLTVSEAVMRLDIGDLPALLFRNRAHGGLNMVYRRPDGNIGWVDPQGSPAKDN
ncbi:MAG: ribosome-associated translation inhibitor RaiA [Rhodospirillaceae bacterium]|nr:ribosome-associated translation inhibitor RaiA [Rhodospirillaceae bacterium]